MDEPTSFQEAMDLLNNKEWTDVMKDAMDFMKRKEVWELADLPRQRKYIEKKWIFTIKCQAYEAIDKFKTHLVAKGLTQIKGPDYE